MIAGAGGDSRVARCPCGTGSLPLLVAAALLAIALAACTPHRRINPSYCDPDAGADACAPGNAMTMGDGGSDRTTDAIVDGPDGLGGGGPDATDGPADMSSNDVMEGPPTCPICPAATPICDVNVGRCTACSTNVQCAGRDPPAPLCATGGGACVVCNVDGDCASGGMTKPYCDRQQCVGCRTSADCPATNPVCNDGHMCALCTSNLQCATRAVDAPVCNTMTGGCVECGSSADCKDATKQICGPNNVCKACTSDTECVARSGADPGICLFHTKTDGRCLSDAEVLYVIPNPGGCSDGAGAGTKVTPFCAPQAAVTAALATGKRIVVLRPGGIPLEKWSYSAPPGNELSVIAQGGATIGPAAGVGVTVTSGDLYIRGLRVTGMQDAGISVRGISTVRLDRCMLTGNKGGLLVSGSGFEIINSVFAGNSVVSFPNSIEYAGVYLGGVPSGPTVFRNNTVADNAGPGVVCGGAYPVQSLFVVHNTTSDVVTCVLDTYSVVLAVGAPYDPKFDPTDSMNPYRLTSGSPCVDLAALGTDGPIDDLDGKPRPSPAGGRIDCGAYEFQKP